MSIEFSSINDPESWNADCATWEIAPGNLVKIPVKDLNDDPELLPEVQALLKGMDEPPTVLWLPMEYLESIVKVHRL